MNDMINVINTQYVKSNICWQVVKHPLFNNEHVLTKSLIAVGLGCDVFEGIVGTGPSVLEKELGEIKTKHPDDDDIISNELIEIMIKKDKKGNDKE